MDKLVHGGGAPVDTTRVFYSGTDTLKEGYALCYNFDARDVNSEDVTQTDPNVGEEVWADARRVMVEKPAEGNKLHFAGVVSAKSNDVKGPAWVEIHRPGSVCNVYAFADCDHGATGITTNTGQIVTFSPGEYFFMDGGFPGAGSATVMQDVDRSTTPGTVMAELQVGMPSGGYQVVDMLSTATAGLISVSLSTPCAYVGVYAFSADSADFVYPERTANETAATASILVLLANGKFIGQRVKFISEDAFSTKGISVVVSTGSKQAVCVGGELDFSAYVGLSAADDFIDLTWNGHSWVMNAGCEVYGVIT